MTIDLNIMKARLEAKRDELQANIAQLTGAHPAPVDPLAGEAPQDFEDVAVDFLETQQQQSLLVHELALLTELQPALKRIEDGTYGTCVTCRQPIPQKRLEPMHQAPPDAKSEEQVDR